MIKILVTTNMYPDDEMPFYGIFVKEQVESLRKLGVKVDVFYINGRKSKFNYFRCLLPLIKKLKRENYDLIHAHHTFCVFLIKIAQNILRNYKPIILTFHEGEIHLKEKEDIKKIPLIKRIVFSKKLKLYSLRLADVIIFVQENMNKYIQLTSKTITLPCGVDTKLFRPIEKEKCRSLLNIKKSANVIFFPASPNNIQKGYNLLAESIRLLNRNDVELICGGDISHDRMPLYMNAADVIVQLSKFEASPSVLKEALSVNGKLVFTDAGDTKSIIGKTSGSFITDRNKNEIAKNIELALSYKKNCNGRQRIFDLALSLEDVAKILIEIYQDTIK